MSVVTSFPSTLFEIKLAVSVPFVGTILTVTNLFVVSAVTLLTKFSVLWAPNPVIAAAVPFAPTAVPLAVAFILVVVGVTVVVNVASDPSTPSVTGAAYPVTTEAVPSAPTAVPEAVALTLVVEGVTVIVGCVTVIPVVLLRNVSEEVVNCTKLRSPNSRHVPGLSPFLI